MSKFAQIVEASSDVYKVVGLAGRIEYHSKATKLLHREDGPAVIVLGAGNKPNTETWFQNGRMHRTDGPAYINHSGEWVKYSVDGHDMSREKFLQHFDDNTRFNTWTDDYRRWENGE